MDAVSLLTGSTKPADVTIMPECVACMHKPRRAAQLPPSELLLPSEPLLQQADPQRSTVDMIDVASAVQAREARQHWQGVDHIPSFVHAPASCKPTGL